MNWLDFVLIFILTYYIYHGFRQGLLRQVLGLASFFIALFLSLHWHRVLRSYVDKYLGLTGICSEHANAGNATFSLTDVMVDIIAFFVLMLLIYSILIFISKKLSLINLIPIIGPLNAIGGAVIGSIKGFLIILVFVSLLSLLRIGFWQDALQASAVSALSRHYISTVYYYINGLVLDNLGKIV